MISLAILTSVPMLLRGLFAALLIATYALVPTAAYADTLDPTWLGGYWDDDDFDYVILLVTDGKAALPPAAPRLHPTVDAVGVVTLVLADAPVSERRPPFYRRGPPLA